jgi:hypothetical protein
VWLSRGIRGEGLEAAERRRGMFPQRVQFTFASLHLRATGTVLTKVEGVRVGRG